MIGTRKYVSAHQWKRARVARDKAQSEARSLRQKLKVREQRIDQLTAEHEAERQRWDDEMLELRRALVRMRGTAAAWKLRAEGRVA